MGEESQAQDLEPKSFLTNMILYQLVWYPRNDLAASGGEFSVDLVGTCPDDGSLGCFRFFTGGVTKGSSPRSCMDVLVVNRTMAPATPGLLGTVPLIFFTSDEPNTKAKSKLVRGIKPCLTWRIGNHTQNKVLQYIGTNGEIISSCLIVVPQAFVEKKIIICNIHMYIYIYIHI